MREIRMYGSVRAREVTRVPTAFQEVKELYMEVRGVQTCHIDQHTDKLARDSIIWSHLAADSVQRMKVARRLAS